MKRGEIYYADLDPTAGNETKKIRPVVIISNNANNIAANTITIVPITSNVNKVYPFEVLLNSNDSGLSKTSKAQCHQIRTISKNRISNRKVQGIVSNLILSKINSALKLHLDLS
ncbi:type II toxin-antitoxin system PemK/MazF family toxin [Legionella waltersii]|uniref:mRNA interferase n=1 Tax=Legionella waltersii TaxID=66969 RepID=A0A0W1AK90_9GAMM|nr:type II toxin-antitoxin system PemK/MazF family toxin [Legionella waltersii]KTD81748.1 mRNA interferase MazF9 [Legionella waltersii]SNU97057.1 PemK-like protein; toxin of a toxin-antitoxin system [Legionella waltersii]